VSLESLEWESIPWLPHLSLFGEYSTKIASK
jgi:hypothetical protein